MCPESVKAVHILQTQSDQGMLCLSVSNSFIQHPMPVQVIWVNPHVICHFYKKNFQSCDFLLTSLEEEAGLLLHPRLLCLLQNVTERK